MYGDDKPWERYGGSIQDTIMSLEYPEDDEEYLEASDKFEEFVASALEVEFTSDSGKRFRTELNNFYINGQYGNGPPSAEGTIFAYDEEDETWRPVGHFERKLDIELGEVENKLLLIGLESEAYTLGLPFYDREFALEAKNSGFATVFNSHAYAFWKYAFDTINVRTGFQGGYVWAKMGFESDDAQEYLARELNIEIDRFDEGSRTEIIKTNEQANIIKSLLGYEFLEQDGTPSSAFTHQTAILALLASGVPEDELRSWIINFAPLDQGTFDLNNFEIPN
jgi:hypothetical protein